MPNRDMIRLMREAEKGLRRVHRDDRKRLEAEILALAENPRPHGAVALRGMKDGYRVRWREWRIVYRIYEDEALVLVALVGHRKDVYRGL
jgi:mRNA interferase RelE/StbE